MTVKSTVTAGLIPPVQGKRTSPPKRGQGDPAAIWSTRSCLTGASPAVRTMSLAELERARDRLQSALKHCLARAGEGLVCYARMAPIYRDDLRAVVTELLRRQVKPAPRRRVAREQAFTIKPALAGAGP